MKYFHTIHNDRILDISQYPEEMFAVNSSLDETILSIRLIRVEMWSLKQLILDWIEKLN